MNKLKYLSMVGIAALAIAFGVQAGPVFAQEPGHGSGHGHNPVAPAGSGMPAYGPGGYHDVVAPMHHPEGIEGQDWRHYPETGHYMAGGFMNFWDHNGGLGVFGYPMTEQFNSNGYMSQYFERQRFEHHPELGGTPYEYCLGRLGVDALQRQGRDWTTFAPGNPNAPHYYNETHHAIAPEFWDYWRNHGLEMGDPGVSHREALALFGFPVSEPTMERNSSGDLVMTQWFERARFEYHPENPEHSRVLLGRLGAELY